MGRATAESTGVFSPGGSEFTLDSIAANADVLTQLVTSTATIISPTEFRLRNESSFAGGTGRFSDATGTATAEVVAVADPSNPLLYRTSFTATGRISY